MNQKKARWRRLDNAAKLYSAASNKRDTRVFRFYCELKEEVRKELLQEALDQTVETFPMFLMVAVLCIVAMNASLDYEHHAVLIGYFCYIFHERWALGIPFCYISMFKEPWALLGFGLTLTYNGERGKQNKLVNYLFYPVHLLILGIIRMYLGI